MLRKTATVDREKTQPTRATASSAERAAYLTVAQAAAVLNCSPKQVRRLIKAGRIPAIDVGTGRQGSYRIRRADIEIGLAVKPPSMAKPRRGRRRLSEIRYVREII